MSTKYVLLGAAGYIAPKHMEAIAETGGEIIAAYDPNDSVGIIDRYAPEARFFKKFELFDDFCERFKDDISFASICSPNYLHDSQARWALRSGFSAIVEKPITLSVEQAKDLVSLEMETGREIWGISQLRYHPQIRECYITPHGSGKEEVSIIYYAPRGNWYDVSWKGDPSKSGGVAFNIGVHLFDITSYLFGDLENIVWVHPGRDGRNIAGQYTLERARVSFTLSVAGRFPKRSMKIGDTKIELSSHITKLHQTSYEAILDFHGWRISDLIRGIELCQSIKEFGRSRLPGQTLPFITQE